MKPLNPGPQGKLLLSKHHDMCSVPTYSHSSMPIYSHSGPSSQEV